MFNIILLDPAWNFKVRSAKGMGRSAENHYSTMSLAEIASLPVPLLANENCAMFMWTTFPFLHEAIKIGEQWQFKYKTCAFIWHKTSKHGKEHMGMGYVTRSNPEPCLYFSKGSPKRVSRKVRQYQQFPVGRHSEKPAQFHDLIVELMGDVPRVELFAREKRDGWVCLGNEIDGLDLNQSIRELTSSTK